MTETLGQRLLRVTPGEVADRSRQEALRRLDRTLGGGGLPRLIGHSDVPDTRAVLPALRGFLSPIDTARAVREDCPGAAKALLERAGAITDGRLEVLGFGEVEYGLDPDWHRDPVHGERAPLLHFSQIDPLDRAEVGDHKVVWEPARHAFLKTLGQAYALTGDPRYPDAAAALLRSWLDANPRSMGIHYSSSLELALRLVNWLLAWPLLTAAPSLDEELRTDWWHAMRGHLAHIRAYLSTYYSPNTHLTGEALALYLGGLLAPELDPDGRYLETGRDILEREFRRQVLPDGLHFERSACYHHYTMEFLLLAREAGAVHGLAPGPVPRELLSRAVDAALALRRPDGQLVNVGDEDGGALLDLGPRPPMDPDPVLSIAAIMLGRGDVRGVIGRLPPEAVWFLGRDALEAWDHLDGTEPPTQMCLPQGGYGSVRTDWGPEADHLLLDVGRHGAPPNAGHAHCDGLAVSLSLEGVPMVVDRGTGSYTDPEVRDEFRGTSSHSTVWIEGQPNSRPGRPFGWEASRDAVLDRWITGDGATVVEGRAPVGSLGEAMHVRRIVHAPDGGWLIWDRVRGVGRQSVVIQFLLPFSMERVELIDGRVITPAGHLWLAVPEEAGETTIRLEPRRWSPRYGDFRPGTAVRITCCGTLPIQCLTRAGTGTGATLPESTTTALEAPGDTESSPGDCGLVQARPGHPEVIVLQPFGASARCEVADLATNATLLWMRGRAPCEGLIVDGTVERAGEGALGHATGAAMRRVEFSASPGDFDNESGVGERTRASTK